MNEKVLLIDGNSLVYRAFYALPLMNNSKGFFTNAIYGYLSMLIKLIEDEKPTHICAVFDAKGKTFRNEIYSDYKANRKPMPIELSKQLPVLKELLSSMNIKILEIQGYEADDVIGSLSRDLNMQNIIVSGDKDVLQLISDKTKVFLTKRGVSKIEKYDIKKLFEDEGFVPKQIIDYKALAGDNSDNIPGAPGIGDITARNLLKTYGSVDELLANADSIKGKVGENVRNNKELILISKKLATIDRNVPFENTLNDLAFDYTYKESLFKILDDLEIIQMQPRLRKILKSSAKEGIYQDISSQDAPNLEEIGLAKDTKTILNSALFMKRNEYKFDFSSLKIIRVKDISNLKQLLSFIKERLFFYIDEEEIYIYVETNHIYLIDCKADLLGDNLDLTEVIRILNNIFKNQNITKIAFDIKEIKKKLAVLGGRLLPPYEDIRLREYVIRSHIVNRNPAELLTSKIAPIYYPFCFNVIFEKQKEEILYLGLENLYYNIELPLIEVLYDIEMSGFSVDIEVLDELSERYTSELKVVSEQIFIQSGQEFNINSPKQLGEILFKHLGIKPFGKTKSGKHSVDIETLEAIDHPIAELIIRYRKIKKLLSTYIDGFKVLIDKKTGKIHTTFQQSITSTGRLSSTNPNLQNIPVRRDEGREVRKMLVPSKGNILITADYSQIELRLLAEFSKDKLLVESFERGEDIHVITASNIFGVKVKDVTENMRRASKAINFGIIYGISPYGLSKTIGTSFKSAKDYVNRYFLSHPQIRQYMNTNSSFGVQNHFIRSYSGRIRFFPEFTSFNANERNFAIRAAMNMPLQGSSSDIIKIAMLKIHSELKKFNLKTKIILQVHDELVFDSPPSEEHKVREILKELMVNAVKLSIPLEIEIKSGVNWYEAS